MQACSQIGLLDFSGTSIDLNVHKVATQKRHILVPLYVFNHHHASMKTTRQTIIHLLFSAL